MSKIKTIDTYFGSNRTYFYPNVSFRGLHSQKKKMTKNVLMLYMNHMLGVLGKMYYVIMLSITIDCLLKIQLNAKYGI